MTPKEVRAFILETCADSGKTDTEILTRAGYSPNVLSIIRHQPNRDMRLLTVTNLLETLGFELTIQPKGASNGTETRDAAE